VEQLASEGLGVDHAQGEAGGADQGAGQHGDGEARGHAWRGQGSGGQGDGGGGGGACAARRASGRSKRTVRGRMSQATAKARA
jgi:hypothetical protein